MQNARGGKRIILKIPDSQRTLGGLNLGGGLLYCLVESPLVNGAAIEDMKSGYSIGLVGHGT